MFGDKGSQVSELQQQLTDAGFPVDVDGDFRGQTDAAVKSFQREHKLTADGIVGPETRAKLAEVLGDRPEPKSYGKLDVRKELSSPDSKLSVAIGMAEGTRTKDGGHTAAYREHTDPVNGKQNQGTFSYQHGASSPAAADRAQLAKMQQLIPRYEEACRKNGLDPSDPILMGNCFDLYNQAPAAVTEKGGFLDQLGSLKQKGLTPENIAEARYRSFYDPDKGKLITGFPKSADGQSSPALRADQLRRATEIAKGMSDLETKAPQTLADVKDFNGLKELASRKTQEFLQKLDDASKPGAKPKPEDPTTAGKVKEWMHKEIETHAKTLGLSASDVNKLKKEVDTTVDGFAKAFKTHTPVPPGKIGFGSQGEEVRQLKQALKDGGFYKGVVNDKMGNDGLEALARAKEELGIGGAPDIAGKETVAKIKAHSEWPNLHVEIPHLTQPTPTACDDTCEDMMKHKVRPGDSNGYVDQVKPGKNDVSIQYMQDQLKAGKPVMIGLWHGDPSALQASRDRVAADPRAINGSDNVCDIKHYVLATGMGRDEKGPYITFNDPAYGGGKDTASKENRLYLQSDGSFAKHGMPWHQSHTFELRGVVRQHADKTSLR